MTKKLGYFLLGLLLALPVATTARASCQGLDISTANTCITGPLSIANLPGTQVVVGKVTGVNFNSANTDNAIAISLPLGFTRYTTIQLHITNASASLTTATCGLFSAAGGTGTQVIASGTAITVSTAADGTNNNAQLINSANVNSTTYSLSGFPTLYWRCQVAEGSAATGDVTIYARPVP